MAWERRKSASETNPVFLMVLPAQSPISQASDSLLATAPAPEAASPECNETTGFFRHLHTPRALFGRDFTLKQVVRADVRPVGHAKQVLAVRPQLKRVKVLGSNNN